MGAQLHHGAPAHGTLGAVGAVEAAAARDGKGLGRRVGKGGHRRDQDARARKQGEGATGCAVGWRAAHAGEAGGCDGDAGVDVALGDEEGAGSARMAEGFEVVLADGLGVRRVGGQGRVEGVAAAEVQDGGVVGEGHDPGREMGVEPGGEAAY